MRARPAIRGSRNRKILAHETTSDALRQNLTISATILAAFALSFTLGTAFAATPADGKKFTYEDDVLPIFRDNCLKCHNPDKLKGDMDLTTFATTLKGGGSGQGVTAGDADGSLLVKEIGRAHV